MVAIDVHLSRRVPVVVHDDDLVRCSDVMARFPNRTTWFVNDFSLAEIRSHRGGHRRRGRRASRAGVIIRSRSGRGGPAAESRACES